MRDILQISLWGNTVSDYTVSLLIFVLGVIFVRVFKRIVLQRLHKWAEATTTTLDDFFIGLVKTILVPLSYIGILYLSVSSLTLAPLLKKIVNVVGMAALTIAIVRCLTSFVEYGFDVYIKTMKGNLLLKESLAGALKIIRVVVWGIAIVFFLDNLGFKISAVIAGLGIGGVAVALAAQAILGDLFSYFAILFDRPFEVGDFIIVGDYLGVVEHVGIKTTRISSLGGEQIVFSNTDLTNSRVRNYKRMRKRRVAFRIGVVYSTPLEKLKEIPKIIEKIIKDIDDAIFDRAHFFSYGDFSLIYEIVYYVNGGDYNKYMDIQQEINFSIYKEFSDRGIEFAYPTQTIYVNKIES